jgi:anti-sigma regulatory factor (Ser/Thr protein kinase)
MRELSLHILDIVENAVSADARHIVLSVVEDSCANLLVITVSDDGRGMDEQAIAKVRDPFYTTRSTRQVGLGLPLFAAAAERCGGDLNVESAPGEGTTVTASFQRDHIDRAPLGNMHGTLMCILVRGTAFDLHYTHRVDDLVFELDTCEIKQELGDVPLSHPDVREWLSGYILQGEQQLKEN